MTEEARAHAETVFKRMVICVERAAGRRAVNVCHDLALGTVSGTREQYQAAAAGIVAALEAVPVKAPERKIVSV